METIINYKLKDFLLLDIETVEQYMFYLELLNPLKEIPNPQLPTNICRVKDVRELTFGEVTLMRTELQTPDVKPVIDAVGLVTGLFPEDVLCLPILDFYGVFASIVEDLTNISHMEENELSNDDNDDEDISYLSVNASQRMSKFGILNMIDSLAGGDLTKWKEIEELPYMTVFTKMVMNKTRNDIDRDVRNLEKQKIKN